MNYTFYILVSIWWKHCSQIGRVLVKHQGFTLNFDRFSGEYKTFLHKFHVFLDKSDIMFSDTKFTFFQIFTLAIVFSFFNYF